MTRKDSLRKRTEEFEKDARFMFHIWSQMEGGPCKPGDDHRETGPCHLPAKQMAERTDEWFDPPSDEQMRTAYENGFRNGSNQAAQRIGGAIAHMAIPHRPYEADDATK